MQNDFVYHSAAIDMVEAYDRHPRKSEEILSTQFELSHNKRTFRRTCQFIFLTLLRNKLLFEFVLRRFCTKTPKPKMKAFLLAACSEIFYADAQKRAKAIHNWVEFAKTAFSKPEVGFANAVLRKCCVFFESPDFSGLSYDAKISIQFSHPEWLLKRWRENFGIEKTLEILQTNQIPSEVFVRMASTPKAGQFFKKFSDSLEKIDFDGFYKIKAGMWECAVELLNSEYAHIQDPSTMRAPKMLNPKPFGNYLDLCASPGGKSLAIADLILKNFIQANGACETLPSNELGLLVSIDLESRMRNLKLNLEKISYLKSAAISCDLFKENLKDVLNLKGLPIYFDGVFLDAPCSNTGVLRRRPDARYRITPSDIEKCASAQFKLLGIAAKFVKEGGRLVYSTCSIDPSENEENVERFLAENKNFKVLEGGTFFPSLNADGCGAFVLERVF